MTKTILSATIDVEDYEKVEQLAKIFGFSKSQILRIALRLLFKIGIYQALKIIEGRE